MELVIFDCDGTLVDSEVIATEVFTKYWASYGVQVSQLDFKEKFIGKGNQHPDNKEVFDQLPPEAQTEGDRLWDLALTDRLEAVPGIKNVLNQISSRLAVGSNSNLGHVNRSLKRTGLDHFFKEHVYSAYQVENPKPAPDLFQHIIKQFDTLPEKCVVVEDSVSGIEAAKNARIPVVGFTGASHFVPSLESRIRKANPDWLCPSAEELGQLLTQRGA